MIEKFKSGDRITTDRGWVQIIRSFAADNSVDPRPNGYGALISIAETIIQPGQGFPMHPHQDMEIVTFMVAGGMRHEDSTGGKGRIGEGEIQRMSAGTGVVHSEYNSSQTEISHSLQIWIRPAEIGLEPGYEQMSLNGAGAGLTLIGAPLRPEGGVAIHADLRLYSGQLEAGQKAALSLAPGRRAWVQVASGAAALGDAIIAAGDGAAVEGISTVTITAIEAAVLLIFDMA
jgi:redox-sensitive bicupin YhaK (pirin superfamily)